MRALLDRLDEQQRHILTLVVASGFAAFFPAGLVLAMLAPGFRRSLVSLLGELWKERSAWLALAVLAPAAAFVFVHPAPRDDLLRDLVVWRHGYDYRAMFWGSPLVMQQNAYLGFDWLVGHIDRLMNAAGLGSWSWMPVTIPLALGFAIALPRAMLAQTDRRDMSAVLLAVFLCGLVWAMPEFVGRVRSGRPEAFASLWALCALIVRSRRGLVLWTLAGLAVAASYWLACVYVPAVLLARRSLRARVIAALAIPAFSVTFWWWAMDGQMLAWWKAVSLGVANRIDGVGENSPFGILMLSGAGVLLLTTALVAVALRDGAASAAATHSSPPARDLWRAWVLKETTLAFAVLAWFAAPNMVRYVDVVVPIMAALIMRHAAPLLSADLSIAARLAASALALGATIAAASAAGSPDRLPDLRIPDAKPGERVLTVFSRSTYAAIYQNPYLQVAPAFELGFSTQEVQKASYDLMKGRISCEWLCANGVHWVIAPPAPWSAADFGQCLDLVRADASGSTIWRMR